MKRELRKELGREKKNELCLHLASRGAGCCILGEVVRFRTSTDQSPVRLT